MLSQSRRDRLRMAPLAMASLLLLVAGAALAFVGLRIGGPFLGGAFAAFAAAATLAGLHSMTTGRHRTGFQSTDLIRDHSGIAAFLFGVTFLVPGLIMVVGGVASALGMADGLQAWAVERPGPALIALGTWVCTGGLAMLISKWKYAEAPTIWWQRLPGKVLGVVVIAMGIGMIVAGRAFALDPENPREVLGRLAEWIAGLLAGGPG